MANFLSMITSNFEAPAFIILSVLIGFVFFYLRKDIQVIKEHLTNHVTGTERKIEKIDSKIDQLRIDMYDKFDKVDDKFDKVNDKFDKIDSKLDSNFKHLNLRLDQAFRPKKEKD